MQFGKQIDVLTKRVFILIFLELSFFLWKKNEIQFFNL